MRTAEAQIVHQTATTRVPRAWVILGLAAAAWAVFGLALWGIIETAGFVLSHF